MGLTIQVGETRPVIDQHGTPIASATQSDLPKGAGLAATMHDQGGILVCTGNSVGSLPFDVSGPSGEVVEHTVTITASAFDWSLGDPI